MEILLYICDMETVKDKRAMINLCHNLGDFRNSIKHIRFKCEETYTFKESLRVEMFIETHKPINNEFLWARLMEEYFPSFRVSYELTNDNYRYDGLTYETFREKRLTETKKIISEISSMVNHIPHDFEVDLGDRWGRKYDFV